MDKKNFKVIVDNRNKEKDVINNKSKDETRRDEIYKLLGQLTLLKHFIDDEHKDVVLIADISGGTDYVSYKNGVFHISLFYMDTEFKDECKLAEAIYNYKDFFKKSFNTDCNFEFVTYETYEKLNANS